MSGDFIVDSGLPLSRYAFVGNEIVVGQARDFRYHPYRGSVCVDYADGVYISGNRFTSEDPTVSPGVWVRSK